MARRMQTVSDRPAARSERLLVEAIGDETVIYDSDSSVAHALSPLASAVFMYADGERTPAQIAELSAYRLNQPIGEDDVREAVRQLAALNLIEAPQAPAEQGGLSRRDALKVFAATGAGAVLISSVSAPFAMAAGVANNYLCATDSGYLENSSGQWLYPQVWSSVGSLDYVNGQNSYVGTWQLAAPGTAGGPVNGSASGDYNLGQPCYISPPTSGTKTYQWYSGTWRQGYYNNHYYGNGQCEYQNTPIPLSDVGSKAQCETYGFYVTGANQWYANAPANTTGGVSGNTGGALCASGGSDYYNVDEGVCYPGNYICVTSDGVWDGTSGGGNPVTCSPGHTLVHLGITSAGTTGVYQCLPCDGNIVGSSYQCCNVVCAPSGIGGVVTPSSWSPSTSTASGPGVYTESACQIWGGMFCSQYASKWCTDNPCNLTGNCAS